MRFNFSTHAQLEAEWICCRGKNQLEVVAGEGMAAGEGPQGWWKYER